MLSELATKTLLSQRIGKGMLWANEATVKSIVTECVQQGSRFVGEIVWKLLQIEADNRLTSAGLCKMLANRKRVVGVFAAPERATNGADLHHKHKLPLMPEMRAMQRTIGEDDCHLCPAASIGDLVEAIQL